MDKKIASIKVFWLAILLSITAWLLCPVVVSADTAAPNLTAINESYVWRNVLETGDYLLVARYAVNYTTIPSTDISDTFVFRLMDTDNINELGVVEAYPYQNLGYGQGIVAWYYDAATAPAWGVPYWIRIEGKVGVFTSPPVYNYNMSAVSYSDKTIQSEVRAEIANTLIEMAKTVGGAWNPQIALTDEGETGTILSVYGEAYFRSAIPGIQSMCPEMFFLQIYDVEITNTTWSTNQSDASGSIVQNSTVGTGITGVASLFNMSFSAIAMIPVILISIVLMVVGAVQSNLLSGMINSGFVLTGSTAFGWFPMGILMIISFFAGVFILYHLLFKNS